MVRVRAIFMETAPQLVLCDPHSRSVPSAIHSLTLETSDKTNMSAIMRVTEEVDQCKSLILFGSRTNYSAPVCLIFFFFQLRKSGSKFTIEIPGTPLHSQRLQHRV
jgi:hypothetical protein